MSWCKKISCFGHNYLALYVLVWFLGQDKFLSIISFCLLAAENETTSYYIWPHFKIFMRYLLSSTSLSHISQSAYHPQNVNILVLPKLTATLEIKACLLLAMYSYMNYLILLKFLFTFSKMVLAIYRTSDSFLEVIKNNWDLLSINSTLWLEEIKDLGYAK